MALFLEHVEKIFVEIKSKTLTESFDFYTFLGA